MSAVEDFTAATGGLPRDSRARRADPATSGERRLARFLRYQRHNELHLSRAQQERLEQLSGFDWAPIESAWEGRRLDYIEFVHANARIPRRRGRDRFERELALWHHGQALRQRRGMLPHHLRAAFRGLTQGVYRADKNG